MNKEFVKYEQALALKELGFDEPCFGYWNTNNNELFLDNSNNRTSNDDDRWGSAPLYQQAFRWFREKYGLNYGVVKAESWFYTINGYNTQEGFQTYEEAENACLDKLIEICKNK